MKKLIVILVVFAVVVVGFSLAKDAIVKIAVEKGVAAVTGLELRIQRLHLSLLNSSVMIHGLKIYNPPEFPDRLMADIPQIYVACDLPAILKKDIHIKAFKLDMREFVVVKNAKGQLNLNGFKKAPGQKAKAEQASGPTQGLAKIRIDTLELKAGKVLYKDYSTGSTPTVKEFNVNIDERYSNISDPYALIGIIISRTLMNTAVGNLANVDISKLTGNISGSFGSVKDIASTVTKITGGSLPITTTTAKVNDVADQATKTAGEAAKSVQDMFKSSFGSGNK